MSKTMKIAVVIMLIAALSVGGFFFWKHKMRSASVSDAPAALSEDQQPAPPPLPDDAPAPPVMAKSRSNVVFILDSSASMNDLMDGKTKMDIARAAMEKIISRTSNVAHISVLTYGQTADSEGKSADKVAICGDIDEIYPLGDNDRSAIMAKVQEVKASTQHVPLVKAFEKAKSLLSGSKGEESIIIVIGNSDESCDGDIKSAADSMKESGVPVYGISLNVSKDKKEEGSLANIARASAKGAYFAIDSEKLLDKLIENAVINTFIAPDVASGGVGVHESERTLPPMTDLPSSDASVPVLMPTDTNTASKQ